MTILPILQYPNPILLSVSSPVESFDEQLEKLVQDMIDTAISKNLIGLSAVQVGVLQNVIIVDFGNEEWHDFVVFVNPKIEYLTNKGKSWAYEGCGSLPNVLYNVERVNAIRFTSQNIHGNKAGLALEGKLARVVQHEENHCRGILINKIGRGRKVIK